MKKRFPVLLALFLALCLTFSGCNLSGLIPDGTPDDGDTPAASYADLAAIPAYSGSPYVILNNNIPTFTEEEITEESYEFFSPLDSLKRCGYVEASVGVDLMPTEDRESISSVTPSGWKNKPYDFVDGGYLYNRCHLLGFQLTGENANKQNLITGTRYMNVTGMLPFENMVADYVRETENHVMYRVTPIYLGDNLVAHGVQLEARSVEDGGEDICFNVYVYNVQPRITIDYATGDSRQNDDTDYAETAINYTVRVFAAMQKAFGTLYGLDRAQGFDGIADFIVLLQSFLDLVFLRLCRHSFLPQEPLFPPFSSRRSLCRAAQFFRAPFR